MHALATIRKLTGKAIYLRPFEEVAGIRIEDHILVLSINTAVSEQRRYDWRVTKRGNKMYTWTRDSVTSEWVMLGQPLVVWWSTDERHGEPARPRDREWEDLCHRPGTEDYPLDNLDRQRQGYSY